jgi:hypothetical protein
MADEDYRSLASGAAGLMASALRAANGRAWVNIGVTQLHCWLDALGSADLARSNMVVWAYGLATADAAWGSWQSPSGAHLRHGFERSAPGENSGGGPPRPATSTGWTSSAGGRSCAATCGGSPPERRPAASHPTVTPVELVARAIRLSTWPGKKVLDPFAGTGTTLLAARQLGRRAIGIEVSER